MAISDVRTSGRATQGVRVIRLDDADSIADLAILQDPEDEEDENGGELENHQDEEE